jgi:YHS domain-containing protein
MTFTYTPITRRTLLVAAIAFALAVGLGRSEAAQPAIYTGLLSSTAVGGFDPVSFHDGAPVAGSRSISTTWMGATWRFASEANKARFVATPEAFAPAYGGYCAWAVSQGYTAKGDPRHWKVVDGRLYLNYDANVQKTWEKDIPGHITKADGNWPKVLSR